MKAMSFDEALSPNVTGIFILPTPSLIRSDGE